METLWTASFKVLVYSILIVLLFFLLRSVKKKNVKCLYSKKLKRVNITGVSLFDSILTPLKLKTGDTKFLEKVFEVYGMNCRIPFLHSEIIAITEPSAVEKVLSSKHDGHLSKPRFLYELVFTDFLKDGLLASTLETWSPHRSAIVEAFNYNTFPTYLRYINQGATRLINSALTESFKFGSGGIVENSKMTSIVHHCTLQIITRMILGEDASMISSENLQHFQETHQRWKDIVLERLLNPLLVIPPIWMFHPKRLQMDSYVADLLSFEHKIVNQCRSRMQANDRNEQTLETSDTIGDLCDQVENVKENVKCMIEKMISANMTNKEIADEIGMFMVAGHETIVVAIGMLSYHLARYPEHQKRCQEEIDKLYFGKMGELKQDLELSQLTKLKYLERCILECLRITPPVPLFLRQLEAPLEIEDGLFLDVGQIVMISPWMVQRNQTFYPNPDIFDPDRFLPENMKTRPAHAFIPFSLGLRNCIGWKVALMELKVLMTNILRNFNLLTEDKPEDVRLLFDVTLKSERSYNIKFIKRTDI